MELTECKEKTTQLKEKARELMNGDVTFTGLNFILIGLICLFAGICIGMLAAPLTHGVSIASNNGSNNGNNNGNGNGYDDSACDSTI